MNMLLFARRNGREILRDPLNLAFGLAFPLALLGLFCAIQANIPVPIFALPSLTPGILVFGFSFFSLFSALLVARDRTSAFLLRLYTTPLRSRDFILGYLLPLLPLAMGQGAVCLGGALIFGLDWSPRLLLTLAAGIPAALLYIGLGLLCGSCLNDRAVGGICGALLTNVSLFLSGAWLDLDLVGSGFAGLPGCCPSPMRWRLGGRPWLETSPSCRCTWPGSPAGPLPSWPWRLSPIAGPCAGYKKNVPLQKFVLCNRTDVKILIFWCLANWQDPPAGALCASTRPWSIGSSYASGPVAKFGSLQRDRNYLIIEWFLPGFRRR